jgi:predicted unusual protein kinase regulating ubiquinone biosynthesis (AarF/ABC1/UbiB family)
MSEKNKQAGEIDNKPSKKKPAKKLSRIKTGKWDRQWALTKAGVQAGGTAAGKMWGNAFLPKQERKARNQQVLSEQAQALADELGKLKGSVVKIGQMLALYGEHILPEEVVIAFRSLEENTIALDWAAIEPIVKQQLGEHYLSFDIEQQALGAASLAQVHKALYKPSGEVVCLKIQYPGVKAAIDSDLDAVIRLLKISRLVSFNKAFLDSVEEIRQLLHREVDYLLEAKVTDDFAKKIAAEAKVAKRFSVPKIYHDFCQDTLLVSSFEAGHSVLHESVQALSQPRKNALAFDFLDLFFKEVFQWKTLQTDPNFGNYRVRLAAENVEVDVGKVNGDKIVLLDFGAVIRYEDDFIQPVKQMIQGAIAGDFNAVKQGGIGLGLMQEDFPDEVHQDFAELCYLLVEPFVYQERGLTADTVNYVNSAGEYLWAESKLPKRAGKHAAKSALSKHFKVPPKEFTLLSRKLLGVYSFIAALQGEFNASEIAKRYIDS